MREWTKSDLQLALEIAYRISEEVTVRSTEELFWAQDRFDYDRREVDEHCQEQRSEAIQRICRELDARNVPLRNPTIPVVFPRER